LPLSVSTRPSQTMYIRLFSLITPQQTFFLKKLAPIDKYIYTYASPKGLDTNLLLISALC